MSSPELLTEDDRQLLNAIDEDIDEADTESEFESLAHDLRDEVQNLTLQVRDHDRRLQQLEAAIEDATAATDEADGPPLIHYAAIPEHEREDALTTSQYIAVTIHENWDDIAWTLGGGSNYTGETGPQRRGVDTKTKANAKYNPSRLRHRLKQHLDREVAWNEVYRALKQLAELSGGEERVDESTGRVHVLGGMYQYEHRATANGSDTKRVCWRVER